MKTKTVIVVEDDSDLLMLTSELLASLELESTNLMITACHDGAYALEELSTKRFDLIITDLRLPGFNGDELIQKIRSLSGPNQKTPIVLTSGHLDDFNSGKASLQEEHAESSIYLLEKPFQRKDLEHVVQIWLADHDLE